MSTEAPACSADSELEKVGSNTTIHIDVRVIAATNKDLQQEIIDHKFREDLYYRLRVVQIHIPPSGTD